MLCALDTPQAYPLASCLLSETENRLCTVAHTPPLNLQTISALVDAFGVNAEPFIVDLLPLLLERLADKVCENAAGFEVRGSIGAQG